MNPSALLALSPLDGRYATASDPLRDYFSESALIRERIRVEVLWFLQLGTRTDMLPGGLPVSLATRAQELVDDPGPEAAADVKQIERRINHDVKAVEYFVREAFAAEGASAAALELVHFGCTSEDINNVSYARLLQRARSALLVPEVVRLENALTALAHQYAALPMLARTHGQPASPTTFGKEMANVAARLARARQRLQAVEVLAKWNGAVGNFNAHQIARPDLDWPALSRDFVSAQGLQYNAYSTQIEPHDWIAAFCDAVAALNTILIDLCRDIWGYVSLGTLRQRPVAGEVGSSTMPHKINPIDFENAEGNFGIANALLRFFADKLPVSRWQRDLTDSTVLRNLGVALAHSWVGWQALQRGLGRIAPDAEHMSRDLAAAWEVLAEAVQTVLRAAGVPNGYELLKEFSRGRAIDATSLRTLIETLPLDAAARDRLMTLEPGQYLGLASRLAQEFVPPRQ